MAASIRAVCPCRNEPPPPIAQKTVIGARRDGSSVSEHQTIRGLAGFPVSQDLRLHVAPIKPTARGPRNLLTDLEIAEQLGMPVGHQNLGIAYSTIDAAMSATPIRID